MKNKHSYCPYCNKVLHNWNPDDGQRFCGHCGTEIATTLAEEVAIQDDK